MSVLDRSALEASPLSDLHVIASELGLDGFRRLRKAQLVEAILSSAGAETSSEGAAASGDDRPEAPAAAAVVEEAEEGVTDEGAAEGVSRSRPRRRAGGRGRGRARGDAGGEDARGREAHADSEGERGDEAEPERASVEGVVELLGNGSGFVRVSPPDPSDGDVYISAAQVRRCELVSGDRVGGPVRRPRRSERFASLVRVETINGAPADEVAEGTRYDNLPAAFPTERFSLDSEDPTLKAVEWLTPFGRGSRVTLAGPPRAGKSEALRRLAGVLGAVEGLELFVVLSGARPEEIADWSAGPVAPAATAVMDASPDSRDHAAEAAVEQGRRIAARGGHAVVLIDSLDGVHPPAARRVMAAARNIVDGGSLTVLAVSSMPVGGETTVITFDPQLAGAQRFPAIDVAASGTMRPELLVGEAGAEAIARARAEASG